MNHGLSDHTIARLIEALSRFPQVDQAILYGSRAKGTHRNGSDIDLTLIGSGLSATHLAQIDEEIDDQLLPYKVDLSLFDDITHPDLLEHIQRVGVTLYERATESNFAQPV